MSENDDYKIDALWSSVSQRRGITTQGDSLEFPDYLVIDSHFNRQVDLHLTVKNEVIIGRNADAANGTMQKMGRLLESYMDAQDRLNLRDNVNNCADKPLHYQFANRIPELERGIEQLDLLLRSINQPYRQDAGLVDAQLQINNAAIKDGGPEGIEEALMDSLLLDKQDGTGALQPDIALLSDLHSDLSVGLSTQNQQPTYTSQNQTFIPRDESPLKRRNDEVLHALDTLIATQDDLELTDALENLRKMTAKTSLLLKTHLSDAAMETNDPLSSMRQTLDGLDEWDPESNTPTDTESKPTRAPEGTYRDHPPLVSEFGF